MLISLLAVSCSSHKNPALDEDFKRGHNGILWGEDMTSAANWIRLQKGAPVQVLKERDPEKQKQTAALRERFIKGLKLKAVPNINTEYIVAYTFLGLRHIMNFDTKDRFCFVTFGPTTPAPPLTKDGKVKGTEKKFEKKIIDPLIERYGKFRKATKKKRNIYRKFWIWEGEKVSYVVEFMFSKKTDKSPAFWQYSESILLASPEDYLTNKNA